MLNTVKTRRVRVPAILREIEGSSVCYRCRGVSSVTSYSSSNPKHPEDKTEPSSANKAYSKGDADPWSTIIEDTNAELATSADISFPSRPYRISKHPFSRGDFFTSSSLRGSGGGFRGGVSGSRGFSTSAVRREGTKDESVQAGSSSGKTSSESSTSEYGSAWDHVFRDLDLVSNPSHTHISARPPSSGPPSNSHQGSGSTRGPPFADISPVSGRPPRRQAMTRDESAAFHDIFNMIFDSMVESRQSDSPTSSSSAMPSRSTDPLASAGIGRGPDGTSSVTDFFGKLRRHSKSQRWTKVEDEVLERKKEQMELCDSDYQLLEWALSEVWGIKRAVKESWKVERGEVLVDKAAPKTMSLVEAMSSVKDGKEQSLPTISLPTIMIAAMNIEDPPSGDGPGVLKSSVLAVPLSLPDKPQLRSVSSFSPSNVFSPSATPFPTPEQLQVLSTISPPDQTYLSSPSYPFLIALLIRAFREKYRDPHLALSIFDFTRHLSIASYVFGCTTPAYNELIQTRWTCFQDLRGVRDALEEMRVNGVEPDATTAKVVEDLRRDVVGGKIEQEGFAGDGEEFMKILTEIERLVSSRSWSGDEFSSLSSRPNSGGYSQKSKKYSYFESWKDAGTKADTPKDDWEFGDWNFENRTSARPQKSFQSSRSSARLGRRWFSSSAYTRPSSDIHP